MQGETFGGERIMQQEFIQQIINTIRENIEGLHTACPGTIVSFDTETGLATVLPSMKFKTPSGEVIDYPQITGVPAASPVAFAAFSVTDPITSVGFFIGGSISDVIPARQQSSSSQHILLQSKSMLPCASI